MNNSSISNEVKQAMITRYLDGQHVLPRPSGRMADDLLTWRQHVSPLDRLSSEINEEDDDDINQVLAHIDVAAFNRWRRPSMAEIGRQMFPVQALPQGASAIYTYSPPLDLADIVTGEGE